MILPHDHDSFAPKDNLATPPPAPPLSSPEGQGPWAIGVKISATIEISRNDAATPTEAIEMAKALMKDLPLHVSIGGVPLKSKYI